MNMQDVYCTNDHEELWLKVFLWKMYFLRIVGDLSSKRNLFATHTACNILI